MTRISDLSYQQLLLAGFQRAQDSAQISQTQLATGKVSNRYSDIGADTVRLLSSEGVITRASAYEKAANVAQSRLQTQEAGLNSVADTLADLRQRFVATLASGAAEILPRELETASQRVLSALNSQLGGVFVFGGTDGSAPPVNAATLSDIGGAASVDALFNGAPDRSRLAVEEGVSVDGGATAREIATGILTQFRDLANAEASLGPFSGQLTDAQRLYLIGKVDQFDQLTAALQEEQGLNGIAQGRVDDAVSRNVQRRDLAELVAADIEDADIAAAITQLNQDQIAIEASGRALAQASQLSLLNFI